MNLRLQINIYLGFFIALIGGTAMAGVSVPNTGATYGLRAANAGGRVYLFVLTEQAAHRLDIANGEWTAVHTPTHGQIHGWFVDPDTGDFSWTTDAYVGAVGSIGDIFTIMRRDETAYAGTTIGQGIACWTADGGASCTRDGKSIWNIPFGFSDDETPMLSFLGDDLWAASSRGLRCRHKDGASCATPISWTEEPRRIIRDGATVWLLTSQALWRIDKDGPVRIAPYADKQLLAAGHGAVAIVAEGRVEVMDRSGKLLRELPAPADLRGVALAGTEPTVYVLTATAIEALRPMKVGALTPELGSPAKAAAMLSRAPAVRQILDQVRNRYLGGARMGTDLNPAIRQRAWIPSLSIDGRVSRSYDDRENIDVSGTFDATDNFVVSDPYKTYAYSHDKVLSAGVGLNWDLDRLLFSSDELSYQSQHRANLNFSEDSMTRAINFYSEWKQKLLELTGDLKGAEASSRWLRVEALEGYLDILTDGWFGQSLR